MSITVPTASVGTPDRDDGASLLTAAAPELAIRVRRVRGWVSIDSSDAEGPLVAVAIESFEALRDWLVDRSVPS